MFISFVRIHFPFFFFPLLLNVSYSYLLLLFFVTECFLSPVIITSGCKAGPALCSCSEIFLRLPPLQILVFLLRSYSLSYTGGSLNDNRVFEALLFPLSPMHPLFCCTSIVALVSFFGGIFYNCEWLGVVSTGSR